MKNSFFIFLIAFVFHTFVYSQNPILEEVFITPANPTIEDIVLVTINGKYPYQSCLTGPSMYSIEFNFPQSYNIEISTFCPDTINSGQEYFDFSYTDTLEVWYPNTYYLNVKVCITDYNYQHYCDSISTSFIVMNIEDYFEAETFKILPNPFTDFSEIVFSISEPTNVNIYIANLYGRKIITIHNRQTDEGEHRIIATTTSLSNGIYFCVMETPTERKVFKIVKM